MQASGTRDSALDSARALAVVAMVLGHTLDALLDLGLRANPWVATYWRFREFTAPLFFLVSGWAVATVVDRSPRTGLALVRSRVPRVLLLLTLGYLLRLPTWGWDRLLAFDREVWSHFLGFDALHCIGLSLLTGVVAFALVPGRTARAATLAALSAATALFAPQVWRAFADGPLVLQQVLGGGNSPFSFFPWASYFFAGASLGVAGARLAPRRRMLLFLVAGVVASIPGLLVVTQELAITDRRMFLYRLGPVLVVAAALSLVPASLARRLAPVGRMSLAVYVVHLPVLYGWGTWEGLYKTVGPTLGVVPALGTGLLLLTGSIALAHGWTHLRRFIERRVFAPRATPAASLE